MTISIFPNMLRKSTSIERDYNQAIPPRAHDFVLIISSKSDGRMDELHFLNNIWQKFKKRNIITPEKKSNGRKDE